MIDKDGEWEVHGGVRLLIKPSKSFNDRRKAQAIESAIAQAERDVVQAERDRCITYLKKQSDLKLRSMAKVTGFTERKLEMSFEDIIESVKVNRKAELRKV